MFSRVSLVIRSDVGLCPENSTVEILLCSSLAVGNIVVVCAKFVSLALFSWLISEILVRNLIL